MTIQLANQAVAYLATAIGTGATSITVVSAALLPPNGNYNVTVDAEIMTVTAVSGTTLTVVRGQEGTTAALHGCGARLALLLTKGNLDGVTANRVMTGTYANRPTSSKLGHIYETTDSPIDYYWNGTSWVGYGPTWTSQLPDITQFSWTLKQGSFVQKQNGFVYLETPGLSNNANLFTTPVSGTFTATLGLVPNWITNAQDSRVGLVLFSPAEDTAAAFFLYGPSQTLYVGEYSGFASANPSNTSNPSNMGLNATPKGMIWLRVVQNASNTSRLFYVSYDGCNFYNEYDNGSGSGTFTPTQVGMLLSGNDGQRTGMSVFYWNVS